MGGRAVPVPPGEVGSVLDDGVIAGDEVVAVVVESLDCASPITPSARCSESVKMPVFDCSVEFSEVSEVISA